MTSNVLESCSNIEKINSLVLQLSFISLKQADAERRATIEISSISIRRPNLTLHHSGHSLY